jgi:hypothetical protein
MFEQWLARTPSLSAISLAFGSIDGGSGGPPAGRGSRRVCAESLRELARSLAFGAIDRLSFQISGAQLAAERHPAISFPSAVPRFR